MCLPRGCHEISAVSASDRFEALSSSKNSHCSAGSVCPRSAASTRLRYSDRGLCAQRMTETDACIGWLQEEMNSLFPGIRRFSLQTPSLVMSMGGCAVRIGIRSERQAVEKPTLAVWFRSPLVKNSISAWYVLIRVKKFLRPEGLRHCLEGVLRRAMPLPFRGNIGIIRPGARLLRRGRRGKGRFSLQV
jgi:hypothetical protein